MIQLTNLLFPEVKRIMIDKKDEDIFKTIMENKGKVKTIIYPVENGRCCKSNAHGRTRTSLV
jgi:competence protein ComGF